MGLVELLNIIGSVTINIILFIEFKYVLEFQTFLKMQSIFFTDFYTLNLPFKVLRLNYV